MKDKKMDIVFPEINFNANEIIIEAERRIEKKKKNDQIKFIVLLGVFLSIMVSILLYSQSYFIILQVLIMMIISPMVMLYNFYVMTKSKEHAHGY